MANKSSAEINITEDILRTLREKPNIKNIYIDADGTIHLNVFDEYKTVKDKKTGKETKQLTGNKCSGGKKKTIVRTLTREEALEIKVNPIVEKE